MADEKEGRRVSLRFCADRHQSSLFNVCERRKLEKHGQSAQLRKPTRQ
ncbi:MAG: hypothetical protein AB2693_26410 [Candidatus Thiodiazotropha sp.]